MSQQASSSSSSASASAAAAEYSVAGSSAASFAFLEERYKAVKGKTDSCYVYLLFGCSQPVLREHVVTQLGILERVADAYRRLLFQQRYQLLLQLAEEHRPDHVFQAVVFVGTSLGCYPLHREWAATLGRFAHPTITFRYDSYFDFAMLADLLLNDDAFEVIKLQNNRIDHIQLTRHKKRVAATAESKALDVRQFIAANVPAGKRYLLFGCSGRLSGFADANAFAVVPRLLKDEELLAMIDAVDNEALLDELDRDLQMMHNAREMHKVLFKNDIKGKILCGQLQRLYISAKLYEKFVENMKKSGLEINFHIIRINTEIKSFVDNRENRILDFDGVVGIAYY